MAHTILSLQIISTLYLRYTYTMSIAYMERIERGIKKIGEINWELIVIGRWARISDIYESLRIDLF